MPIIKNVSISLFNHRKFVEDLEQSRKKQYFKE